MLLSLQGPKVLAESSSSSLNNITKYYVGRITDYEYVNEIPPDAISNIEKDGHLDVRYHIYDDYHFYKLILSLLLLS